MSKKENNSLSVYRFVEDISDAHNDSFSVAFCF